MTSNPQQLSNDVVDGGLHFLNARNIVRPDHQRKVCNFTPQDFAAVITEQSDGQQVPLARFLQRLDDVFRPATGGDGDSHVIGARVSDQLSKKYILRSHVVGERGNVGGFE